MAKNSLSNEIMIIFDQRIKKKYFLTSDKINVKYLPVKIHMSLQI